MQKATVTASQPTGQWEGQYGVLYTFDVTATVPAVASIPRAHTPLWDWGK